MLGKEFVHYPGFYFQNEDIRELWTKNSDYAEIAKSLTEVIDDQLDLERHDKEFSIRLGSSQISMLYAEGKGWGLFAKCFIPVNTVLCGYFGEPISFTEAEKRKDDTYNNQQSSYILVIRETIDISPRSSSPRALVTVVDATRIGGCGSKNRFINHSCYPNSKVLMFRSSGSKLIGIPIIRTIRDIEASEEISISYGAVSEAPTNGASRIPCLCKSRDCLGFLPFENII